MKMGFVIVVNGAFQTIMEFEEFCAQHHCSIIREIRAHLRKGEVVRAYVQRGGFAQHDTGLEAKVAGMTPITL